MDITSHRNVIEDILKTRPDGKLVHHESQTLEFKESFNYGSLAEYYRDFAAFANNKGGYLVFGVKDKPRKRVGLNEKSKEQFDNLDPEGVTGHLLEDFGGRINWEHSIIELDGQYFGYFYVAESKEKPIICKKDEGKTLKVGKAGGPTNAAILDLEKRTLDAEAQVLVVDEKLVERIKFVKEGEFVEKEGAPALKLVGDVTPVNKVEVVDYIIQLAQNGQ